MNKRHALNRKKDATAMSKAVQTETQAFIFDRYGNRNFDEEETTTLPKNCGTDPNFTVCTVDRKVVNPSINASNNRLSTTDDYAFDNSGNTTEDAQGRTFIYDAENKQVKVLDDEEETIGEYFYDGDGRRVKKFVPAVSENPAEITIFVYDAGKLVAEYSTIVASSNDAKVAYLTNDHLGSPRINTDKNGNVTARHDYHPFGEEIATSQRTAALGYPSGSDGIRKQFTGYERDNETSLDFAQARMYSKQTGRFVSPDPRIFRSVFEPGAWNLYVYALNDPIGYTDRIGLWPEWIHRAIIESAFPGLDPTARAEIARGNTEVDRKGCCSFPTLEPRNSHQHSQTSDHEDNKTEPKMLRNRSEFIASAEAVAKDPANRYPNGLGNARANYAFGRSRHPMQDERSPEHSGKNSHYATPSPLAMSLYAGIASLKYLAGLGFHWAGERKIDPATFDELVKAERKAYGDIFGREALRIATDTRRYTNEFLNSDYLWSHLDDSGGYSEVVNCSVNGESCF